MRLYRALGLALALALLPSSMPAQTQFAVSGFGGVFLPASDLLSGIFPLEELGTEAAATFRQKTAFQVGGRLTVWPTPRFGIEAEAVYALSDMHVDLLIPDAGPPLGLAEGEDDFDANVLMGSVNAVFALIRPPLEPLVVFVSAGIGFVSRGAELEDGTDIFEDKTDIAGTWGFGLKYGVARGVWLRGDVRDYVSVFQEGDLESKWQNDLLVSVGLEYSFGG